MNARELKRKKKIEEISAMLARERFARMDLSNPIDRFIVAEWIFNFKYHV